MCGGYLQARPGAPERCVRLSGAFGRFFRKRLGHSWRSAHGNVYNLEDYGSTDYQCRSATANVSVERRGMTPRGLTRWAVGGIFSPRIMRSSRAAARWPVESVSGATEVRGGSERSQRSSSLST